MSKISHAELYRIINRAIAKIDLCSGECVNDEMSRFGFEYTRQLAANVQLSLFDEYWPSKEEVRQAMSFCDDLEKYREFSDPYLDDSPELDEKTWRRLYERIQDYRQYTHPENLIILSGIENSAMHQLPEFRPILLIQDYNKRAGWVFHEKKAQEKLKRKNEPSHKGYEQTAAALFEDILQDKELANIKPCQEKIELLQNCLKLVDCLPREKYGRIKKFDFKSDINCAIMVAARALGDTDLAENAHQEMVRFETAKERATSRSKNYYIQREIYDRRMREEWMYK